jgi:hypothetical protein
VWVALVDDSEPLDAGVQGYLKISVQIIGPGDKMRIHNDDVEIVSECAREIAACGDVGSLALIPPSLPIQKQWKYLVVGVYRCETLPVMDGKIGAGLATFRQAGTDAYGQVG